MPIIKFFPHSQPPLGQSLEPWLVLLLLERLLQSLKLPAS
jgi:hypothetical protein